MLSTSSLRNITYTYSLFCSQKYLKFLMADVLFLGLLFANLFNIFVKVNDSDSVIWVLQNIGYSQALCNLAVVLTPSLFSFGAANFLANFSRGIMYTYVIQTVHYLLGSEVLQLTIPMLLFLQALFGLLYASLSITMHGQYHPLFMFTAFPLCVSALLFSYGVRH